MELAKKRRRHNQLKQSTRKRDSSNSISSDDDNHEKVAHSFAASGSSGPAGPQDQGATATLEIDTEKGIDSQAQFERVQKQLKDGVEKDGKILYKGMAMYGAKEAQDTAKGNASSGMNRVGPVRAPQFLRQTVRWDFAPDICKDYKETGFCTFGDSCKFVHDRGDYKHGWEIDQDYEEGKYNEDDTHDYEIHEDEETFPEVCSICDGLFKDPIVTRCKHYFCEGCAMKAFKKSKRCPECNEDTAGIMNVAKDMLTYLKKKAEKAAIEEVEDEENEVEPEPTESVDVSQQPEQVDHASEASDEEDESHDLETSDNDIEQEEVAIDMEDVADADVEVQADSSDNDDEEEAEN